MKLVVGLGNPGPEYDATRHNVGWWLLDHLADVWHFEPWRRVEHAETADGVVGVHRVRLLKPLTYMNRSGIALQPYARHPFWSPARDLLVAVDDVALPIGRYRMRSRGSAGGHNGLKSLEWALDTRDYPRLRIGIHPPVEAKLAGDLAEYVLAPFSDDERDTIRALLPRFTAATNDWVTDGIEAAMNLHNRNPDSP